jgi:UPF0755 protein
MTLLLIAVLGAVGGAELWVRAQRRPAAAVGAPPVRFTIPSGASAASIGRELEAKGVIRSALVWERIVARDATIRPGVYDLSPAKSPDILLRQLARGETATVRVTIPEGFTIAQIAARLQEKGMIRDPDAFVALVRGQGQTFKASFSPPADLEGYLFPDTYRFPVDASPRTLAQGMLSLFDRLVAQGLDASLRRSRRPLSEIVVIASMVEREARTDADRPRIAGVIANRLERRMRLEIDATVQYARGAHKSRLFFKDLEIDSPYNTYRRIGLPPGPICSPGLPSLKAALAPERSSYLYYVARADGSHVFARTFDEHRANIAQVRRAR